MKIIETAIEGSDDYGWANLGDSGTGIPAVVPDFDTRTCGCRNLGTLVEKSGFEIGKGTSGGMRIRRKATKPTARAKAGTRASGKT